MRRNVNVSNDNFHIGKPRIVEHSIRDLENVHQLRVLLTEVFCHKNGQQNEKRPRKYFENRTKKGKKNKSGNFTKSKNLGVIMCKKHFRSWHMTETRKRQQKEKLGEREREIEIERERELSIDFWPIFPKIKEISVDEYHFLKSCPLPLF